MPHTARAPHVGDAGQLGKEVGEVLAPRRNLSGHRGFVGALLRFWGRVGRFRIRERFPPWAAEPRSTPSLLRLLSRNHGRPGCDQRSPPMAD